MNIEKEIQNSSILSEPTRTVINLMYTARQLEDGVAMFLKPYGLTTQQYNVLRILRGQKGAPANLSTLNERMIAKSSNTTRLVDKLIKKDLAHRDVCETNRRKVEIVITPNGLSLLSEIDEEMEQNNAKLLKNLAAEELQQLNNLLDKIRE
ncbi:MAG: MarR family transcriptional regulator [Flavobacteriaceae bacterium]|nr:MarR family transcriptional regulator [Flavobacteriaceae bacterium]